MWRGLILCMHDKPIYILSTFLIFSAYLYQGAHEAHLYNFALSLLPHYTHTDTLIHTHHKVLDDTLPHRISSHLIHEYASRSAASVYDVPLWFRCIYARPHN